MIRKYIVRSALPVLTIVSAIIAVSFSWQCKDNCVGQPAAPPLAYVRFIHASPNEAPVDMLINNTVIVSNVAFNTYTPATCCYRNVAETGVGILTTRLSGTTNALLTAHDTFMPGEYYTVILIGKQNALQLMVLHDTLNKPAADSARIRFIQAIPYMQKVNVTLAGKEIVSGLSFGGNTGYLRLKDIIPGVDTGALYVSSGIPPYPPIFDLANGKFYIPGNTVLTCVLLGEANPNGTEPVATITIFDDADRDVNGLGDVLIAFQYGAIRLLNAIHQRDSIGLDIFNYISQNGLPPNWRNNFPDQSRLIGIANDSVSGYLLLPYSNFITDAEGNYFVGVKAFDFANGVITDSTAVDPFIINHRYTVAVVGDDSPNYPIVILQDTLPDPPQNEATIRFFNASPVTGQSVSLTAQNARTLFQNIPFETVSQGTYLQTGITTFKITSSSGATASLNYNLQPDSTYTVIAKGIPSDNSFSIMVISK